MKNNWKQKKDIEFNWMDSTQSKLGQLHDIDTENIKKFIKPSKKELSNTRKLLNIKPFILRIVKAFEEKENIVVIGDPD